MKKVLLISILLLSITFVFAAPVLAGGIGTTIPDTEKVGLSISISAEENFVFDRDLDSSGAVTGGEVEESNQMSVILGLQPTNFLNIYGKVGAANLEAKYNWNVGRNHTIEYDYGLLLGGGVNLVYEFENNYGIGWDTQISWWNTDADSISGSNGPSFTAKGSVDNYDIQSTIYAKYKWNLGNNQTLVPYVGGYYSFFESNIDNSITVTDDTYSYTYGDIETDDSFGVVAGLNFVIGENFSLNAEGRFIAETALTGGGTYRF